METVVNKKNILWLLGKLVISPGPIPVDSVPLNDPSIHLNKESAHTTLSTALSQMGKPSAPHREEDSYLSSLTGHVRPCHILDSANNLRICVQEKKKLCPCDSHRMIQFPLFTSLQMGSTLDPLVISREDCKPQWVLPPNLRLWMHLSQVNSIILSLGITLPSRYKGMNAFIYLLKEEIYYWLFNYLWPQERRKFIAQASWRLVSNIRKKGKEV